MTNLNKLRTRAHRMPVLLFAGICVLTLVLTPAAQAQTYSVIHSFTGTGVDGAVPWFGVTIRGNALYGTTQEGGAFNKGTVYQLAHVGSNWVPTTLSLLPSGGYSPQYRPNFGPDGRLYASVYEGGEFEGGSLFDLIPPLSICNAAACYWTQNVLYGFGHAYDGLYPDSSLIWDPQGNIYGVTSFGGLYNHGTVYQMTKVGDTWTETPIYQFQGMADGGIPQSELVVDSNGNLFGTAGFGGQYGYGVVYELTNVPGVGWEQTVLYAFQNGSDGSTPIAGLVPDGAGGFYGVANGGGNNDGGTIFQLSPSGSSWTYKVIYTFGEGSECGPWATLSMDSSGNLYGGDLCGKHTWGAIFKLSHTQNGWVYSSLYDFTGQNDGGEPITYVSIDSDGTLYGTTTNGGSAGRGTVWMIKP